jgi:hypothetical protein
VIPVHHIWTAAGRSTAVRLLVNIKITRQVII